MRVLNVIRLKGNYVVSIESFAIYEEQLSNDVVKMAEDKFKDLMKRIGFDGDDDDMESYVEDGIYVNGNESVNMVWSDC